jgi:glutamate synthase (NADH)
MLFLINFLCKLVLSLDYSMKLDKAIVQRRLDLMAAEGVVSICSFVIHNCLLIAYMQTFVPNAHIGVNIDAEELRQENDALVICTGATWPRDLRIPGRETDGIHFAMEFLQVSRLSYLSRLSISFPLS